MVSASTLQREPAWKRRSRNWSNKPDDQVRLITPNAMRILQRDIERRVVIESYARYDCSKKGLPIPDFSRWNWSQANEIDKAIASAQLKAGVPAGYVLWDIVELTFPDLCESAVVADIFPNQSRKLGLIESAG